MFLRVFGQIFCCDFGQTGVKSRVVGQILKTENPMIAPKKIKKMETFVGREVEWKRLISIGQASGEPAILVVYGRRRIGKTELLEQAFAERNILKFEGIRGKSQEEQKTHVL